MWSRLGWAAAEEGHPMLQKSRTGLISIEKTPMGIRKKLLKISWMFLEFLGVGNPAKKGNNNKKKQL